MASSRIKYRRVFQKRARNRQALALAARKPLAAVADQRLIALRHLRDEIVGQRRLRRSIHFFFRHVRAAVAEIVPDRVVEKDRFLRDDRHLLAQRTQRHIAHIVPVDRDRRPTSPRKSVADKLTSVVLPAPLDPTIATTAPAGTFRLIFFSDQRIRHPRTRSSHRRIRSPVEKRGSTLAPGASIFSSGKSRNAENLRGSSQGLQEQLINLAERLIGS